MAILADKSCPEIFGESTESGSVNREVIRVDNYFPGCYNENGWIELSAADIVWTQQRIGNSV